MKTHKVQKLHVPTYYKFPQKKMLNVNLFTRSIAYSFFNLTKINICIILHLKTQSKFICNLINNLKNKKNV